MIKIFDFTSHFWISWPSFFFCHRIFIWNFILCSGCAACVENYSCKYSKNSEGNNASFNEHINHFFGIIIFREATGSFPSTEIILKNCSILNILLTFEWLCCKYSGCWAFIGWACQEAWWKSASPNYSNFIKGSHWPKPWQKTSESSILFPSYCRLYFASSYLTNSISAFVYWVLFWKS